MKLVRTKGMYEFRRLVHIGSEGQLMQLLPAVTKASLPSTWRNCSSVARLTTSDGMLSIRGSARLEVAEANIMLLVPTLK